MSGIKNLEKLWGIGTKTAERLVRMGIVTLKAVAKMDVSQIALTIHRPESEIEISKKIAKNVPLEFIEKATENTLPIAKKIWGIGVDVGLYLLEQGIKTLEDVSSEVQIIKPDLPNRLKHQLSTLHAQVQLALIPSLNSRNAKTLAQRGIQSLKDLSTKTPDDIKNILPKESFERIEVWLETARELVTKKILEYKDASVLPLVQLRGIQPELGAALLVSGIHSLNDLILYLNTDIRDRHFDRVSNKEMEDWIRQAIAKTPAPKTWKLGITKYSLLPDRLLKMGLEELDDGDVKSTGSSTTSVPEIGTSDISISSITDRPRSKNWGNLDGKDYTTPAKSQGNCGACVSFSVVATVESHMKIIQPLVDINLSEAHLHFCGKGSCGGWSVTEALRFAMKNGITMEQYFEFPASTRLTGIAPSCNLRKGWDSAVVRILDWRQIAGNAREEMKLALHHAGPLIASIKISRKFKRLYPGGVFRFNPSDDEYIGGHWVEVIGYDDIENCWICKNSWGDDWGESRTLSGECGYFRMGYGECGIESQGGMILINVNPNKELWRLRPPKPKDEEPEEIEHGIELLRTSKRIEKVREIASVKHPEYPFLVTAVRDTKNLLTLISWNVATHGKITQQHTAKGGRSYDYSIDVVPNTNVFVTALRTSDGMLKLISWKVNAKGEIRRFGESLKGEKVSLTKIAAIPRQSNYLITATRLQDGNMGMIKWKLESNGSLVPQASTGTGFFERVNEISMAFCQSDRLITVVSTNEGNLRLYAWGTSGRGLSMGFDSGQRGEHLPIGLMKADLVQCVTVGHERVLTSHRGDDSCLRLLLWDFSDGNAVLLDDSRNHLTLPVIIGNNMMSWNTGSHYRAICAYQTRLGALELFSWKVESQSFRPEGKGVGDREIVSLASICPNRFHNKDVVTPVTSAFDNFEIFSWRAHF